MLEPKQKVLVEFDGENKNGFQVWAEGAGNIGAELLDMESVAQWFYLGKNHVQVYFDPRYDKVKVAQEVARLFDPEYGADTVNREPKVDKPAVTYKGSASIAPTVLVGRGGLTLWVVPFDDKRNDIVCILATHNGEHVPMSVARQHYNDEFNLEKGCRIALGRALIRNGYSKEDRTRIINKFVADLEKFNKEN